MKKITILFVKAALMAVLGVASAFAAWGATKTEGFETATAATSYNSTATIAQNKSDCEISWSIYYGNVSTTSAITGNNSCLMRYYTANPENLGYAKTTTGIQGLTNITFNAKVTNTGNKMGVWYSTDGSNWTAIATEVTLTTSSASKSYDIPNSSTSTSYYVKIGITSGTTNKKDLIIDDVVFSYTTGGGSACSDPTFSPAAGAVLSGTTVTLSTSTDGASIYYTMGANPADPTSSSTLYSTPISVTEATTIKAIAIKDGMTNSAVASASYTILEPLTTMDAIFTEATSVGSTATSVAITFNNWVVSGVKNNNAYVTDGTKGFIIYQSGHGFSVGNILSGTALCKVQLYHGSSEITNLSSTTEGLTVSGGGIVTPVSGVSISSLSGVNTGAVYNFENLSYDGTNLSDGANEIKPYTTLYSGTFENGKSYNVTGVYLQYDATKELLPRSAADIEEIVPIVPTVLVSTSSLSGFTYDEGFGPSGAKSFTVNGTNLTDNISLSMGGSDFEMSRSENSDYTTSLSIVPEAGEVTDITIYVRLKADKSVGAYSGSTITLSSTGAENKTVSLSGTVNVSPFAALPFSFSGDSDDVPNTAGLTANGLGNYNTSPKLKFDTTGDYLILRINERPGTLTFDIKNNSFSGGTFSVQTSTDGSSYSVLKNYSSITDTQHESFDDLDADIRYIKWVYTEKSAGNVAIGNIQLTTVAPVVSVANTAINVDASGAEGIINVSYKYFTLDDATTLFYESDGSTSATYDWLSAEINGANNIAYSIDPYHGNTPRTAYFKVFAMDDSSNSYLSELITVTQAAYSAGFAELPFEYDGNGTGALPTGLSTHGLGTYANSPKMKFDDTGDYLVLQFASQASSVSFDIKGNGFSGGTFTVQGSTDGISYNDLKSYTELGDKKSESIDLASSIRYIRWIYTSKSSGNVALGNIAVSAEANPTTITLTASPNGGRFWVSFYNSSSLFTLPAGAEAFTMNSSHQLYRLGTNGSVIPKNTAVIIISDASTVTLTKGSDAAVSINGGGNILLGSNSPILVSGISGTPYVLGIKKGVVGFYQYTDTNIPANKAYYVVE